MEAARAEVSVIATVFNEVTSIHRLLDSLTAQTRLPDEVVIVDGGSGDGTYEALQAREARGDLPLRVLQRAGANISAGRNAAIGAARGPVIAATDAGVRLAPGWLASITAPFDEGARLVAGFFVADPMGAFETALGATTLPEVSDIDPARFLPSSRSVAFLKSGWSQADGYPEWLDYGEDLVFDFRVLSQDGPAVFAPDALVRFRPRPTLRAFARQYYLYARGDGKANLWPWRHAIRYATYLVAVPLLAALALVHHPLWIAALLLGLGKMVATPYRRLRNQWGPLSPGQRLAAALWVPLIQVTGDMAKMVGYPVGLRWRWRHQPPAWRPSPEVGRL